MTTEEAKKIVAYYSIRTKASTPEKKAALEVDLVKFNYEECKEIANRYVLDHEWFPTLSEATPSKKPELYKPKLQPGIKGKEGIDILKGAIARKEQKWQQSVMIAVRKTSNGLIPRRRTGTGVP